MKQRDFRNAVAWVIACLLAYMLAPTAYAATSSVPQADFSIPVEYYKLDNGLKVVLSHDPDASTAVVVVEYAIGGRLEPPGRGGFAHLFEHLMFQGSANLAKGEFAKLAQSHGGLVNGSTGFDFTTYFSLVPSNTLRMMLWAEADRMRGLALTATNLQNQKQVVENELKMRVLNQPYGGFPSLIVPGYVYSRWNNAHLGIGTPEEIQAATLDDVKAFFHDYYVPNNAVLVVSGNFDPDRTRAWIRQYFSTIPASGAPPRPPLAEPAQAHEKRAIRIDPLAPRPALAIAYRMPPRNTPEFLAMGLINEMLAQGHDSPLYQQLVQRGGFTSEVANNLDISQLFGFTGPQLYIVSLIHDPDKPAVDILAAVDKVVAGLRNAPPGKAMLDRAKVKIRADFYHSLEMTYGFGRGHLLALFAMFDDDPGRINHVIDTFDVITPQLIEKTAREYLRPSNRTILFVKPKGAAVPPASIHAGGSP